MMTNTMMPMAPMAVNVAGTKLLKVGQSDFVWGGRSADGSTVGFETSDFVSEAAETARIKQKTKTFVNLKMHELVCSERHILNEISGPTAAASALSVLFMRSTQWPFQSRPNGSNIRIPCDQMSAGSNGVSFIRKSLRHLLCSWFSFVTHLNIPEIRGMAKFIYGPIRENFN